MRMGAIVFAVSVCFRLYFVCFRLFSFVWLLSFAFIGFVVVVGRCRQVRGAPLIAIVAALGLAVEASNFAGAEGTAEEASAMLHGK